jgi:nitroreductase
MNLAEAFERIAGTRRSVYPKDYLPGRVDDEVVMKMLELADRAPTHKRTEPWRFTVFTGEGLKRLAEFQAACYKKVTEATGTYKEDRYQNLLVKPMESSHIIAVGMKRDAASGLPEWEELGAVFCAVENIYLAATANGIGCYLSTGGVTNFEEAKEYFTNITEKQIKYKKDILLFGLREVLCYYLSQGLEFLLYITAFHRRPTME